LLPVFMARNERILVRLLPHDVRLSRTYWLVTHADSRKLARVRAVADHVRAQSEAAGTAFWEDAALGPAPRDDQASP
jgi:DNA-binding transcriptional LysR family regulator